MAPRVRLCGAVVQRSAVLLLAVSYTLEEFELGRRELGDGLDALAGTWRCDIAVPGGASLPADQFGHQDRRHRYQRSHSHRRNHLRNIEHPEIPQLHVGDMCTE